MYTRVGEGKGREDMHFLFENDERFANTRVRAQKMTLRVFFFRGKSDLVASQKKKKKKNMDSRVDQVGGKSKR